MKFLVLLIGVAVAYAEDSSVLQNFSEGYIQFSADVYKELLKSHSGNFLVCPLSVETVLALAHIGAEGDTAMQITKALHLPEDKHAIQQIFEELIPKLEGDDKYDLSSANKIYVKKNFEISKDFKNTAINSFNSEIENIDFNQNSEAASVMNNWVEEKTHNKIKDLISKDDLNEDTRAVLINALYFHGKWATKFDVKDTQKKTFHVTNEKETKVDMMEQTSSFKYYESSELNAKFLEMPYKGKDVTMTIVLPNDVEGLSSLEEKIANVLRQPEYRTEKVHVQIPKFKIESKIQFKDILVKLGVVNAFEDFADFSGIGAAKDRLKISKIVQKTFIEVEEKGTTAAASTALFVEKYRSGHVYIPPKEFNANHPFIYYLRSPAGILFIGRYMEG
ncbi:hypothetical protein ILUMI_20055 [Ignelater luminosus]|uniref:Serpin domain-containing protein n=1 Tax=Ignelater luminosus TaxID=2038154 RepID=A0A8K0CF00_IGNLU|nr:hypothetical protein ILUMI_20055 [Ignelater luminosus]